MLGLAIGVGLVGGAALVGRRSRELAATPKSADLYPFGWATYRVGFNAMDAAEEANRWFEWEGAEEGADICSIRNRYFNALDKLKEARLFQRRNAGKHGRMQRYCGSGPRKTFWVPEAWGGSNEETPSTSCEAWAAGLQWTDDAFALLHDAKASYERACPHRTLPDARQQKLSGTPIAQAITPNMSDADFVDELHFRAHQAQGHANDAFRSLYDAAEDDFAENPDCGAAKVHYMQARDAVKESRSASRAARMPRLVRECRTKISEKCRRFRDARYHQDTAMRMLPHLRDDIREACGKTMPAPFAGARR